MTSTSTRNPRSYVFLFITALLWGFAFAAQRIGGNLVGPFSFNGIRFVVGTLSLVPLLAIRRGTGVPRAAAGHSKARKDTIIGGAICGSVLFVASSLQQVGLIYTTAAKAAFLTGLYIILVPIAGLLAGKKQGWGLGLGAALATGGLYLLSVRTGFSISGGDTLEIICAFFWAAHILLLSRFAQTLDPVKLAFVQNITCAVLCILAAFAVEGLDAATVIRAFSLPPNGALIPLLYSGIASIGIAYTLQIFGQKGVAAGPAALIMSLESVFAALGGWIILGETMDARSLTGAALMLAGLLAAQLIPATLPKKKLGD